MLDAKLNADEAAVMAKFEELVRHFLGGHTLKSYAGMGRDEMEAIYATAHNFFQGGNLDKATELMKLLCLYDHTEFRWFYGFGTVRQAAKDWPKALEAYGLATLLDMEDPRPQAQAGYCLMALERWPEAESALEGAILACDNQAPRHADVKKQAEELLSIAKAKSVAAAAGKKGKQA